MAFHSAHRLSFRNYYYIFVYATGQYRLDVRNKQGNRSIPNLSFMMPRMPAMLDTRFAPESVPSISRKPPEGLSTTSVGAEGTEGEVKA